MLVLTRYIGQSIIIDGEIEVTVVSVDRNQVRIGVKAPKEIPVNRSEIQEKIDARYRNGCLTPEASGKCECSVCKDL
jgi:carbon storage regulator